MRIKIRNELLPLGLLVIVLITTVSFFPSNILRIILGLPFVLFFPGYTLIAAIFPRKEGLSGIERVALSFGMSIAVVPIIGLILNYTPWGIKLESILWAIASFIFIMIAIAGLRRRRLQQQERFGIEFHLALPSRGMGIQDKLLSTILVLTVLGALGMIGYIIATPKIEQEFTEFYILGLEDKATDYPRVLKVGEEGRVRLAIVNHEHDTMDYRIEMMINGVKNNEVKPIVLDNDKEWTREISFIPEMAGENQKVEFLLYKNGEAEPYLEPLHLWLDVTE